MRRYAKNLVCALAVLCVGATPPIATRPWPDAQRVPDWFGKTVEQHVRAMECAGYYSSITDGVKNHNGSFATLDFFHGHLLTRGSTRYPNIDEFLQSTVLILYHTQELTKMWEREAPTPSSERIPRSILGYPDGGTLPAIQAIGIEHLGNVENYEQLGTVFDWDVARTMGGLENGGDWRTQPKIVTDTTECIPGYQFHIRPDPHGRYTTTSQRFEVWLRCHTPGVHKEPPMILQTEQERQEDLDPFTYRRRFP